MYTKFKIIHNCFWDRPQYDSLNFSATISFEGIELASLENNASRKTTEYGERCSSGLLTQHFDLLGLLVTYFEAQRSKFSHVSHHCSEHQAKGSEQTGCQSRHEVAWHLPPESDCTRRLLHGVWGGNKSNAVMSPQKGGICCIELT